MKPQPKPTPRADYRDQENRRIEEASTLADEFSDLCSLTAELEHFGPEGNTKNRGIKYTFNLMHAKSLVRFDCPNDQCVGGDFDLTAEIAKAVSAHRKKISGEVTCNGWRSSSTIGQQRCLNVLHYKFTLAYKEAGQVVP